MKGLSHRCTSQRKRVCNPFKAQFKFILMHCNIVSQQRKKDIRGTRIFRWHRQDVRLGISCVILNFQIEKRLKREQKLICSLACEKFHIRPKALMIPRRSFVPIALHVCNHLNNFSQKKEVNIATTKKVEQCFRFFFAKRAAIIVPN